MKLFHEGALLDLGDEPLKEVLGLWHELCEEKIGTDFEVMVGNRREHHQLASFKGELNVATPHIIENQPKLIVWVDNTRDVKSLLLTHEIGHWILKLQGFRGMINRQNPHSDTEIVLNSLLHHPGVYAIQRRHGQDPKESIEDRFQHSLRLFKKGGEGATKESRIQRALMIVDDYMHVSVKLRAEMDKVLREKHKLTKKLLAKQMKTVNKYELTSSRNVEKCGLEILKCSGLGIQGWEHIDEIKKLRSMVDSIKPK
jgi:hypothetical protein